MSERRHGKALEEAHLDLLLGAISDRTRRAIIARLVQGEARVTEVAEPFGISLNAVSKHVRVLEESGIVRRRIEGRDHFLSVNLQPLDEVDGWLTRTREFWNARIDSLEDLLRRKKQSRRPRAHEG
jgi:DNA-binding transcriptional ArsR family regulator